MPSHYTPAQIAAALGLSPQTVRAYLRERFPRDEACRWWRLGAAQHEIALRELRVLQNSPSHQPLRELRRQERQRRRELRRQRAL